MYDMGLVRIFISTDTLPDILIIPPRNASEPAANSHSNVAHDSSHIRSKAQRKETERKYSTSCEFKNLNE